MSTPAVQRKLVAILSADVVGYSRLMGADEVGTLRALNALREELIAPTIAAHRGRIVNTAGDSILTEFASAVNAINCAIAFQQGVAARNLDIPRDRRIEYCAGINVGDVIVEGEDISGDGVNIAARLEGAAQPGGICISEDAYRQVRGRVSASFNDLGEQRLKNIVQPIRVYAVALPSGIQAATSASVATAPLTPRLSIVVLPVANLGGQAEQDDFVDGITEILTTDLSRIPDAFVIAGSTAFTYKGKAMDTRQIGRELGVRYVMEGSVQSSAERVRVSAQLIDAETGGHLWAERFDKPRADLFDMQDEITSRLARALGIELVTAEGRRAQHERPNSLLKNSKNRTAAHCRAPGLCQTARNLWR